MLVMLWMEPVSKGNTFIVIDQLLDQTGGQFLRSILSLLRTATMEKLALKIARGLVSLVLTSEVSRLSSRYPRYRQLHEAIEAVLLLSVSLSNQFSAFCPTSYRWLTQPSAVEQTASTTSSGTEKTCCLGICEGRRELAASSVCHRHSCLVQPISCHLLQSAPAWANPWLWEGPEWKAGLSAILLHIFFCSEFSKRWTSNLDSSQGVYRSSKVTK